MIFKLRIGHWRITFTIAPVIDVIGVNSLLPDGNHIIMWDFDEQNIYAVSANLGRVQQQFNLPPIYILRTGKPDHYIAYCFQRNPWHRVVNIIAATIGVDPNFFKYGVYRERFTLRVSAKEHGKPELVWTLKSPFPEDCSIAELNSWVKYETLADSAPMRKREWNIGNKPS